MQSPKQIEEEPLAFGLPDPRRVLSYCNQLDQLLSGPQAEVQPWQASRLPQRACATYSLACIDPVRPSSWRELHLAQNLPASESTAPPMSCTQEAYYDMVYRPNGRTERSVEYIAGAFSQLSLSLWPVTGLIPTSHDGQSVSYRDSWFPSPQATATVKDTPPQVAG